MITIGLLVILGSGFAVLLATVCDFCSGFCGSSTCQVLLLMMTMAMMLLLLLLLVIIM